MQGRLWEPHFATDRKYPLPEIQNPNLQSQGPGGGSGGDMHTTLSFMLLVILLFFGYEFFVKPKPTPPAPPAHEQSQTTQGARSAPAAATAAQQGGAQKTAKAALPAISAKSVSATTIENGVYRIVFSNQGGEIKQWFLKKYNNNRGTPLNMVQPQIADRFGYPLSFFTYDPALNKQLNQALYKVTVLGGQRAANGALLAPATIRFEYAADGIEAVKTIHFDSSYVISVDAEVTRNGAPVRALLAWPAGLGDMTEFRSASLLPTESLASAASQFMWSANGKLHSIKAVKVSGNATLAEPFSYAAITDLYFAAAFLPNNPDQATVVTLHHAVELPTKPGKSNGKEKMADVIGLAMGSTSGITHLRLFAGPKETDVLNSIHAMGSNGTLTGPPLTPLIQFGWFSIIAKPLYLAMRFLHHLLGPGKDNWGWAIVIVTLIVNMLMLPTRMMMMKSSVKMMRIQPKVEALKRKYAHLKLNDPKRTEMNTEMMQLYQSEGVSLYGGCLPMLIQMPLLYAVYEVLENAIELRQAHWLWLPDLSMPDPYYILPILIIITMFLVQYITPSPGMDPAQRRMMAFFMPVMFGFFMLHFPSGLALYWGMGNIINLIIQLWINQSKMGKEMHAMAARRAAKKAGDRRALARR